MKNKLQKKLLAVLIAMIFLRSSISAQTNQNVIPPPAMSSIRLEDLKKDLY